jgi:hypothetical protein
MAARDGLSIGGKFSSFAFRAIAILETSRRRFRFLWIRLRMNLPVDIYCNNISAKATFGAARDEELPSRKSWLGGGPPSPLFSRIVSVHAGFRDCECTNSVQNHDFKELICKILTANDLALLPGIWLHCLRLDYDRLILGGRQGWMSQRLCGFLAALSWSLIWRTGAGTAALQGRLPAAGTAALRLLRGDAEEAYGERNFDTGIGGLRPARATREAVAQQGPDG